MCVGVLNHPILTDEAFATHFAREWLLARMEAHVAPQICLVVELFRTHLTFVRLVAGVLSQVLLSKKKRGFKIFLLYWIREQIKDASKALQGKSLQYD